MVLFYLDESVQKKILILEKNLHRSMACPILEVLLASDLVLVDTSARSSRPLLISIAKLTFTGSNPRKYAIQCFKTNRCCLGALGSAKSKFYQATAGA